MTNNIIKINLTIKQIIIHKSKKKIKKKIKIFKFMKTTNKIKDFKYKINFKTFCFGNTQVLPID